MVHNGVLDPGVQLLNKPFTLERLEQVCAAAGLTIAELVRISNSHAAPSGGQQLTLAQEQALAADPRVLACFYLLLNGRQPNAIATELDLTEREVRRVLVRLDAAKLIALQPKLKVRLRTSNVISWRTDGPVRRLYEQQVKSEFLNSDFAERNELIEFGSAELSDASARILARRVELLAREFAELAALDAGLPRVQKRSMGMLLALRPWVFSMYDGLRRKGS